MNRRFRSSFRYPMASTALALMTLAFFLAPQANAGAVNLKDEPPQVKGQKAAERNQKVDAPAGQSPELRDETFRLMDAYLISNLQESIGLSDDQFAKALPLVKKLQADRRDCAMRRLKAIRMLRKSLNSGSATEASVADLLKELKSATSDERSSAARNIEALDANFTPLQQAKYRVFEAEVDMRLRHLLARTQDKDHR